MAKKLAFKEEARQSLKKGIDTLAHAIRITLGPKGRNLALLKKTRNCPLIVNQGVAVADEIDELEDGFESLGMRLLKQAAKSTAAEVGDGTTTAIVLAHAIIIGGVKVIAAGANPMVLRRGIIRATRAALDDIRSRARGIEDREEIAWVATSACGSEELGRSLAHVVERVGGDGVIKTAWDRIGTGIEIEFKEKMGYGLSYDQGYISPHFASASHSSEVVVNEPYILIVDKVISDPEELLPLLGKLLQIGKRDLVIIAKDVKEAALGMLIANKSKGVIDCVAVKAPAVGELGKAMLEDIATIVRAVVVSDETGRSLPTAMISDLGHAKKVSATEGEVTILGGKGDAGVIKARLDDLRAELESTEAEHLRRRLQERIAFLSREVAVMKVGGMTRAEMEDKKARLDDALMAVYAAMRGGVVPGGGVALLNASCALDRLELGGDEAIGVSIVRDGLDAPMRRLAENAGREGSTVVANVRRLQRKQNNENIGYDVMTDEYADMMLRGIVDPAEVVCSALVNAASCAAMILTTDALVAEVARR